MASVALLALLPGALLPPDYAVHADTSHMPPLPGGRRLRLLCAPDTSTAGLGGRLWDASSELCAWQLSVANQIRGKRLLELGSGATGACGIFAAGLGASRVVLTDGGNEALMRLLEWNAHAANEEDGPETSTSHLSAGARQPFHLPPSTSPQTRASIGSSPQT